MIKYMIITLIVTYVVFYLFFKLKDPFWARQPVFHFHNLWYWLFPPGIIQHSLPIIGKYYDPTILFKKFED